MSVETIEPVKVQIEVNGEQHVDLVEPRLLLVHYLRDVLGLTGTHIGCDTTQCGACTVMLDGMAVKSCTMFAVQADGGAITTIEGLGGREGTHPVQQAFHQEHALQCGYCTPGFVMATTSLLAHNSNPTDDEINRGLEGNICRCTGYVNILHAVKNAMARLEPIDADRREDSQ